MSARKSDCVVGYTPGGATLSVTVASSVAALFGKAVETAARRTAAEFGVVTGTLSIDDDGALDCVVAARVEAAFRAAGMNPTGSTGASAKRTESARARAMPPVRTTGRDRRRRSRLYVPGDQPDLLPNAGLYGADCLILDLEDSVAPSRKVEARILLRRVLEEHRDFFGTSEIAVRVNSLSGPWGADDIAELAGCLPDALVLPKCESADEVVALADRLDALEEAADTERGRTSILPIVETAKGVLESRAIAAASPRVAALCFGAEDFCRDIGARRTSGGMETVGARQAIVMAAKAAGAQAHDSVFSDVDDVQGFASYCAASKAMGFDGIGLVHPRQIAPAHKAFDPSEAELTEAERIVAAMDQAEAQALGVASLDGMMIDAPVAARARRIVAMARDVAVREDAERAAAAAQVQGQH